MTAVRIGMFGDGNIGKTCMCLQFVTNTFTEAYDPTIEDTYTKALDLGDNKAVNVEILDTSGQTEFASLLSHQIKSVESFVICYSITKRASFNNVGPHVKRVLSEKGAKQVPMVLIGTKSDCESERQVSTLEGQEKAKEYGCPFFEVSGKIRANIDEPFIYLVQQSTQKKTESTNTPEPPGTIEAALKAFQTKHLTEEELGKSYQQLSDAIAKIKSEGQDLATMVLDENTQSYIMHELTRLPPRTTLVHLFIKEGVNIDQRNKKGKTALWVAAEDFSQTEAFITLKMYIDMGANTNLEIPTKNGKTKSLLASVLKKALSAARYNNYGHITTLIKAGANPNVTMSRKGEDLSLLHVSCIEQSVPCFLISALLRNGANPFALDHKKRTPFHYLAQKCKSTERLQAFVFNLPFDTLKKLTNTPDISGQTPLHRLCTNKTNKCVIDGFKLLVACAGAELLLEDCRGHTPISLFEELIVFKDVGDEEENKELVQSMANHSALNQQYRNK